MTEVDMEIQLNQYFCDYEIFKIAGGSTSANLYRVATKNQGAYILKTQNADSMVNSLRSDKENYEWLRNKVPVPAVRFFSIVGTEEMLCMTEQSGKTLDSLINDLSYSEIIYRYACSLRLLHSLPIDSSAKVQNIDIKISNAKSNIDNCLVNIDDLEPENRGVAPLKLFDELLDLKPAIHELVFTHGDYCFDNVIYNGNRLSGFIDIGAGGVADKYQDIAIAVRNIRDYFGNDFVDLFLREYGLSRRNEDKLKFYALLDEFF